MYGAWDRSRTIVLGIAMFFHAIYFFRWGLLALIAATCVGVWLLHD